MKIIHNEKHYFSVLIFAIFLVLFSIFNRSVFFSKLKERYFFRLIHKEYIPHNDWHNTSVIREWAASSIPSSSQSLSVGNILWRKGPLLILAIFSLQYGGVDCAGYSYTLMKLYKEFGYTSYSYHSGNVNSFNHVITIVDINYKDDMRLVVQDATFDAIYTDKKGDPYDFFELLSVLQKKEYSKVDIVQGNSPPHLYICDMLHIRECRTDSIKGNQVIIRGNRKLYYEKYALNPIYNNKSLFLMPRFLQTKFDETFTISSVAELISILKGEKRYP